MIQPLRLQPIFQERVWGGKRLKPDSSTPIGEAWVVYEGCLVEGGDWHGQTLGQVAEQHGADLLGPPVVEQTGKRFPILVKLLHSLDWLSVQVHPNDEQAARLEGPEFFGKTEAWHILEAADDARVVYGLDGNWSTADLERLIQVGEFERALRLIDVSAGDTLFTPAGCVHAIGPGLFVYEVQQTSDITYRLFDWNRPASDGRQLHLDKGLGVIGPCGSRSGVQDPEHAGPLSQLAGCDYFALERIELEGVEQQLTTGEQSFHALTVTQGAARLKIDGVSMFVGELETALIPAAAGEYIVEPVGSVTALVARAR